MTSLCIPTNLALHPQPIPPRHINGTVECAKWTKEPDEFFNWDCFRSFNQSKSSIHLSDLTVCSSISICYSRNIIIASPLDGITKGGSAASMQVVRTTACGHGIAVRRRFKESVSPPGDVKPRRQGEVNEAGTGARTKREHAMFFNEGMTGEGSDHVTGGRRSEQGSRSLL
jgi:hypothetical protein